MRNSLPAPARACPLPLREEFEEAKGATLISSGWGTTSTDSNQFGTGGQPPAVLQYVNLTYVDTEKCKEEVLPFYDYDISDETSVCAYGGPANPPTPPPQQDTCSGVFMMKINKSKAGAAAR